MIKRVAVLIAGIICITACAWEARADLVFVDNFDRTELGPDWTTIDGSPPPGAFIRNGKLEYDSGECVYGGQTFDGSQPTSFRFT